MLKKIILSLSITLSISIGIGFILKNFIGFAEGTLSALIIQFIIFYILDSTKSKVIIEDNSTIDELISLQTVKISCPCGRHTFFTPIFFNLENIFTCEKCNSKFKVDISFDSILLTEPLNIEQTFNFLKSKELS